MVLHTRFGAFLLLTLPLLLLLFPDGRLPAGRWWRPLSLLSLASTAVLPVTLVLVPAPVMDVLTGAGPVGPEAALDRELLSGATPFWPQVLAVAHPLVGLSPLVPFAAVVARHRSARGERRMQLRWLVWAGLVDAVAVLVMAAAPKAWQWLPLAVAIGVTSAAVVVAVTRHRLYDIDRLLSGTVVSVLLLALVATVDLLVLALAGNLLGGRDVTFLAVAVVAVLYTPLRTRLWGAARRLVRGRRDPYGRCPRWPSAWNGSRAWTGSWPRWPGRWPRPSGCPTSGSRPPARTAAGPRSSTAAPAGR